MNQVAEAMIPITMFLVAGLVTVAVIVQRYFKRKLESQEILAAIEKGVEVKFPEPRGNRLLTGLIWLSTGIVMTLAMFMVLPDDAPSGLWVWGLIPVAVGASYLYVQHSEKKDAQSDT
jgi:hypothetical protein